METRKVAKRGAIAPGQNEAIPITQTAEVDEKPIIDKPAETIVSEYEQPKVDVKKFTSSVDEEFQIAEQKLISYVSRQLELMENNLIFKGDKQPSLYELDLALCSYEHVLISLNQLYNAARFEVQKAKEAYDEWYAIVFMEMRDSLNPRNQPASKWYSSNEIGYAVRAKYKSEHAKFRAAITLAEQKRSMIERLVEGWRSYQFVLTTLSKNSIAEYEISQRAMDRQVE